MLNHGHPGLETDAALPTCNSGVSSDASKTAHREVSRIDRWFFCHLDLVAVVVIAIGVLLRLLKASGSYLNPDEATHYLLANQPSLAAVYRSSLTNAHPPLVFFLLYFWRYIGTSEVALRSLSLLAGTASLWFVFRWIESLLGRTAGLAALLILAVSPAAIAISVEVRGYALLLLLMAMTLYFLERAFKEQAPRMIVFSSLTLCLAILTHYSTFPFALALGIYVLIRIFRRELPTRVAATWVGLQAGAVALYAFLYVTHISKLHGSGMQHFAVDVWLRNSYFHPGQDQLLFFPFQATLALFKYLFYSPLLGIPEAILFIAAIWLLLAKRDSRGKTTPDRRFAGLLLLLPFLVSCGVAVAGLYPYGGTRHSVFLMLFAVSGISFLIADVAGERIWPLLLAALFVAPAWNLAARRPDNEMSDRNQSRSVMTATLRCIRQTIPPGSLIFSDYQTNVMLGYYLGSDQVTEIPMAVRTLVPDDTFVDYSYGGYQVVAPPTLWTFDRESFVARLASFREEYQLKRSDSVWVVDAGWGATIGSNQFPFAPDVSVSQVQRFGDNIIVFQVKSTASESVTNSLAELARRVAARRDPRLNSVFWPNSVSVDSALRILNSRVDQIVSYNELYASVRSGERQLENYLPALAFWIFNTTEPHLAGMRYMNDGESYIASGFRFTLLGLSPDSAVGAYELDAVRKR